MPRKPPTATVVAPAPAMKTISIKELHAATGKWVRAAKLHPVRVTDRGKVAALLVPESAAPRAVFDPATRPPSPRSNLDSTVFISEDRDGR